MSELLCLLFGHQPEVRTKKVRRFTRWGETGEQFETQTDVYCKRCGKWEHPYRNEYLGV